METADERRARLVGVARDLIARDGVANCTFRRLAAAAGTSTRPFTHAFGTRDNLLREVALSTWDGSPLDVESDDDVVATLVTIGEHWLPLDDERYLAERIYFEIVLFALTRPALREELMVYSTTANSRIATLIAAGQKAGRVRMDVSAEELTMAFWALQAGMAFTGLYETDALPPEMARRVWRDGVARLVRP